MAREGPDVLQSSAGFIATAQNVAFESRVATDPLSLHSRIRFRPQPLAGDVNERNLTRLKDNRTLDYRGEYLGVRLTAERCQAIVRDHGKKTWSLYGAPDAYPREQKYWTGATQGCSIVRLAIQALRNEIGGDLLEVLTGRKAFGSADGGGIASDSTATARTTRTRAAGSAVPALARKA
jgi:hypothetical protein